MDLACFCVEKQESNVHLAGMADFLIRMLGLQVYTVISYSFGMLPNSGPCKGHRDVRYFV